jgi:hypothetical protein
LFGIARGPRVLRIVTVAIDEQQHVALPKLYGQPAYARPTRQAGEVPRPFDPDDLPLQTALSEEERSWVDSLPPRAFRPGGGIRIGDDPASKTAASPNLTGRPFRLRSLAGKLRQVSR